MVHIEPNDENGLSKESAADCFQVRSVSQVRLIKKIGFIGSDILEEIKEALKIVFSI
jgi:mRNA interferase MazF